MIAATHDKPQVVRSELQTTGPQSGYPVDANEIALQLTGRSYVSHSAISTYQTCPLRYHFTYIAQLPKERVSASLVFGGAIHSALEAYSHSVMVGEPAPSVDELVTVYQRAWKGGATSRIKFGKGDCETSLQDLARRMLQAFVESPAARIDGSILGVEEELRAPIIPGCPDVLGRLDLLVLTDNHLRVIDFKTSKSKWSTAKIEESTPPMLLYAELVRPIAEAYGDLPIRLEWIVLTKTKTPSVEVHTVNPAPEQLARIKTVVKKVWDAIAAGHFYPAPSAQNCSTCPFRKACETWEG